MNKETPFNQITIRVISTGEPQKTKFLFPSIVNNKGLMRNMGFVVSDPQYDAKMDAFKNKRPFSENGQAKVPAQESFAPKVVPVKAEPVTQPKNEVSEASLVRAENVRQYLNEVEAPEIKGEPTVTTDKPKRTRRTKAQMEADKLTSKQNA